jgi:hypothetical protein
MPLPIHHMVCPSLCPLCLCVEEKLRYIRTTRFILSSVANAFLRPLCVLCASIINLR